MHKHMDAYYAFWDMFPKSLATLCIGLSHQVPYITNRQRGDLQRFLDVHPNLKNLRVGLLLRDRPEKLYSVLLRPVECLKIDHVEFDIPFEPCVLPHTWFLDTASSHLFDCPRLTHLTHDIIGHNSGFRSTLVGSPMMKSFSCSLQWQGIHRDVWDIGTRTCTLEHVFIEIPTTQLTQPWNGSILTLANSGAEYRLWRAGLNKAMTEEEIVRKVHLGLTRKDRFPRLKRVSIVCSMRWEEMGQEATVEGFVRKAFGFLEDNGIEVIITTGESVQTQSCSSCLMAAYPCKTSEMCRVSRKGVKSSER